MKMLKEVQREIQESQLENEKQEYLRQLDLLNTNRIAKRIIERMQGESIEKIYYQIAKEELKHTSSSFFPGDIVILYPTLKEQSSKKVITCDFSGAIIYPKSLYINYRPLLENISKHITYVLEKTIKIETSYADCLPTNIEELEELEANMLLGKYDEQKKIDFSHFNQRMGGKIYLKQLKKESK